MGLTSLHMADIGEIDLIATTAFGLEAVVARELEQLGYVPKITGTGRVEFKGDGLAVCRANMWLRAADRVLIKVGSFEALDFGILFEGVKALDWARWIGPLAACPVNGRSIKSHLSSVPACQRMTKKAIVESLRAAHKVVDLPETGPRVVVEVGLLEDVATLTIDTSGEGLHKRGYRQLIGDAQIKETMAAGLVLLSVWRPHRPLVDPFCGSGTIPIEAALIGRNMAPGLYRTFDAVSWGVIADSLWDQADEEARDLATGTLAYPIHGYDISEDALSLARHHAKRAGVQDVIQFQKRDFRDLSSTLEYGCIIANPPYGDRIGRGREIEELYRAFPDVLRRLPTWSHHIITSWDDFERLVGQPATRRRKLYNAQIECTYYQFLGPKPPREDRGTGILPVSESETGILPVSPAGDEAQVAEFADDGSGVGEAPNKHGRDARATSFGGLRPRDIKEIEEFAACLANNAKHLRKYPSRGISCYRLYERDAPDVPVIVDRYENRLHIAEYEREHGRTAAQHADWMDLVVRRAAEVMDMPIANVYAKRKQRQRGTTQHERVSEEQAVFVVNEGGLKFEVNLSDYVDTGLFLDHRLTRDMVRKEAAGKRFLNLFCYTGSFTVYAAAGGAKSTTSVDLSNTYLSWTERNLKLNTLPKCEHELVKSDVIAWLREQEAAPRFDLAVVDPPTFSNSKSTEQDFDVQRDHVEILRRVLGLMSPAGVVYFSNNYRRFKLDEAMLAETGWRAMEISRRTVPPEYRNERIHQCWRIVRAQGGDSTGSNGEDGVE